MNSLVRGRSEARKFLLGPLCIFFCYLYKNYLRMGKSEDYAKGWAPSSALGLLIGPMRWFLEPINYLCDLATNQKYGSYTDAGTYLFLAVIFIVGMVGSAFLKNNHSKILEELSDLSVPRLPILLFLNLSFGLPLLIIPVALYGDHFSLATAFLVTYYTSFYLVYFRRLLSRNGEPNEFKGEVGG